MIVGQQLPHQMSLALQVSFNQAVKSRTLSICVRFEGASPQGEHELSEGILKTSGWTSLNSPSLEPYLVSAFASKHLLLWRLPLPWPHLPFLIDMYLGLSILSTAKGHADLWMLRDLSPIWGSVYQEMLS